EQREPVAAGIDERRRARGQRTTLQDRTHLDERRLADERAVDAAGGGRDEERRRRSRGARGRREGEVEEHARLPLGHRAPGEVDAAGAAAGGDDLRLQRREREALVLR